MYSKPHSAIGLWQKNSGFTLVELVISIVLLGMLAAVGTGMIADSFDTTYMVNASEASAGQARYALERMEREIREIKYVDPNYSISTMTSTKMVFTKTVNGTDTTVTICNGTSPGCAGSSALLTLGSPSTTSTLSSQVGSFALAYFQADGVTAASGNGDIRFVRISLTLTDPTSGQSMAQRTRISLRNK